MAAGLAERGAHLYQARPRPFRPRNTDAMEDAMAIPNLLDKNVPRAELDERAREARVRLERLERLLVPRVEEQSLWLRPLVRLVSFRVERNARRSGQTGGSMSNPRGGCMPEAASVSRD